MATLLFYHLQKVRERYSYFGASVLCFHVLLIPICHFTSDKTGQAGYIVTEYDTDLLISDHDSAIVPTGCCVSGRSNHLSHVTAGMVSV